LIIRDNGVRRFSEHVMKQTRWMVPVLGIKDRKDLPPMRIVRVKGEKCLSVRAEDPAVAKRLLDTKLLGPCKVLVEKDTLKNSVAGVLYDRNHLLSDLTVEEIEELLKNQGVTKVIRFTKGQDKTPTQSYKIIFDRLICPSEVDILHHWCTIREYIPPPVRCFHCQKYDHAKKGCRNKDKAEVCQRCGQSGHEKWTFLSNHVRGRPCQNPPKCINCGEDHESGDKNCDIQKKWRKVQENIVLKKMSKLDAKISVFGTIRSGRTDVQVVTATREEGKELENANKTAIDKLQTRVDSALRTENIESKIQRAVQTQVAEVLTEIRKLITSNKGEQSEDKTMEDRMRKVEEKITKQEEELSNQRQLITQLSEKNEKLEAENTDLRRQLEAAKAENEQLKKEGMNDSMDTSSTKNSRKSDELEDSPDSSHGSKAQKIGQSKLPTLYTSINRGRPPSSSQGCIARSDKTPKNKGTKETTRRSQSQSRTDKPPVLEAQGKKK